MNVDIFKQLLQEKGISAYRLAKEIGVSDSLISQWKMGKQNPNGENLINIANYFDVSVSYLMGQIEHDVAEQPPLSDDEQQLLNNYRQLGLNGKAVVLSASVTELRASELEKNTGIQTRAVG